MRMKQNGLSNTWTEFIHHSEVNPITSESASLDCFPLLCYFNMFLLLPSIEDFQFFLFLCCIFHPSNDENRILGHLPTLLFIAVDEKNLLVSDDVDE